MKLFAFLFLCIVLMALVAYDQRAYVEARRAVADINKVTQDIDIRGQQLLTIQKNARELASNPSGLVALITEEFPQSENIEFQSKAAARWGSIDEMSLLQRKINSTVFQNQSHAANDKDEKVTNVDEPQVADELMDDLEKAQALDVQLSDYISDELLGRLPTVVGVNVAGLLTILLVSLGVLYRDNLNTNKKNLERNRLLENRHEETLSSRKMMISITEDLSEQKRTAEHLSTMLEHSNKSIKSKNEEMEQFIYTVSHDLKSPLVSIGGFSSILTRELSESLTEKQMHYLSRIQSNVTDMESLLGDLLDLSRITNQEFRRSTIDTDSHIEDLLESFDSQLREIDGEIDVVKPLIDLYANERLLRQCLSNLVSNAINYRSKEKPLKIHISSSKTSTHTILCVKDNGIGIDKKYHDLVFRIFEHLDSNLGTGVGLTIVKSVLEKHGGRVRLESELGNGCAFHLEFPNDKNIRKVA